MSTAPRNRIVDILASHQSYPMLTPVDQVIRGCVVRDGYIEGLLPQSRAIGWRLPPARDVERQRFMRSLGHHEED